MPPRAITIPGTAGGPASYTLAPGDNFSLRSVAWRQLVAAPVSALDPAVPELLAFDRSGKLIARVSAAALVESAPTTPGAPSLLSATGTNHQVSLLWDAPLDDGGSPITHYKVYVGLASGAETLYATVGNVLGFAVNPLVNNTPYFFKVSAVNAQGEGPLSNELTATPNSACLVSFSVVGPALAFPPGWTFPVTRLVNNNPSTTPINVGTFQAFFQFGATTTQHATLTITAIGAGGEVALNTSVGPSWNSPTAPPGTSFNAPGVYTFDVIPQLFSDFYLQYSLSGGQLDGTLQFET